MNRVNQMIRRCKRKGGDCPCSNKNILGVVYCEAEKLLSEEYELLTRRIKEVEKSLAYLTHKPCTINGWKMPPKPEGDYVACVILDDGWYPHWYSETEQVDYIEMNTWPFVEDVAYAEDWEKIGFKVV